MNQDISNRINRVTSGERLALTRSISMVENELDGWEEFLSGIYSKTGNAYRIGITGPPGAGKSSLTQKLISEYLKLGKKVAVIAVDPTSPFTGGAILGDRVRMQNESMKPGVFVRSMATRGSLGGLNTKTQDVADILDAAGYDIILIETVGVGQSELDIAQAVDTTVVVLVPESGDSIQAMKSGLMEIADLFILNKADREGADQAVASLKTILTFRITHAIDEWIPDVVKTIANNGTGIDLMIEAINNHKFHNEKTFGNISRKLNREKTRVKDIINERLRHKFWTKDNYEKLDEEANKLINHQTSPLELAIKLIKG